MDPDDGTRHGRIKRQCLSSQVLAHSHSLCECSIPAARRRASKSTRCRAHEFCGTFSSIVPRRTKADPAAVPIVGLSDKFCSPRIADPLLGVSLTMCLLLSSSVRELRAHFSSVLYVSRYSWDGSVLARATSRTLRIAVGSHPPFVPRVTTISPPHYCTGTLCVHL